jgi:hypothetical protein
MQQFLEMLQNYNRLKKKYLLHPKKHSNHLLWGHPMPT